MHIDIMKSSADRVSSLLKLLSSSNRLIILCQLVEGDKSVSELCRLVDMKPPAMSQQLAILRREGLLSTRREGQAVFYAIADQNVQKLMDFLYEHYCE